MSLQKFGVGQAVKRVEDQRFITGKGCYTTDVAPARTATGVLVRSPHAHARFKIGDLTAARAMPGVLLVVTHPDIAHLGPLPCLGTGGIELPIPEYPVLAREEARHVGDAIAFIVAETDAQARDAVEAFPVQWEPLPAVVGIANAEKTGVPLVWPEYRTNVAFDTTIGDKEKTDRAFEKAEQRITFTVVNNRIVANYMEPRACLAEYDERSGRWTLTVGSQGANTIRDVTAHFIMKVTPERMRVITPDVGGGFGTKIWIYREYPLCAVAAEKLKRPVRWVSDRTEHFVADTHGRDNLTTLEMALSARGKFLGLRVDLKADMGAYLSIYAPFIPNVGARMSTGCYDIPAIDVRIRGYYTHTVPVDAYRGAGRPEAAYVLERFVDHIARSMSKSPDALRAMNFVSSAKMPYKTQTDRCYDSGEFEAHMRLAMERADWDGFKDRLKVSKRNGRIRGIGLASYIEACAGGGAEGAEVRIEKDGSATVVIGTQSTGQGHETAFAQLVSEALDLPPERVRVVQGDTDLVKQGGGTGGSRSVPVGGASVIGASKTLAEKLKSLAAEALEAAPADLEIAGGAVRIAGTDRSMDFAAIAALPRAAPEALTATEAWTPPEYTYPNGTHVCELEIDPDTGIVSVERYTVVDDFGVTLNPLLLAGQVHGGAAQGIGQALCEHTVFDGEGQLVSASFMDYQMPRAIDIPSFHFETRNVRCTTNILGMKGAGEAGAIGSTPAAMNAVCDALFRAYGVTHIDMPVTPARLHAAIAGAKLKQAG